MGLTIDSGDWLAITDVDIDGSGGPLIPAHCLVVKNNTALVTVANVNLTGCSHGLSANDSKLLIDGGVIAHSELSEVTYSVSEGSLRTLSLRNLTLFGHAGSAVRMSAYSAPQFMRLNVFDTVSAGHDTFIHNASGDVSTERTAIATNCHIADATKTDGLMTFATWGARGNGDPLMVDAEAGDYRPTSRSPLLHNGVDGGVVGGVAADPDDLVATPGFGGWYWEDTIWPANVTLTSDVVVPAGRTLTIPPGARVAMGPTDNHGTGYQPSLIEIRAFGTLVMDGDEASPIRFEVECDVGGRRANRRNVGGGHGQRVGSERHRAASPALSRAGWWDVCGNHDGRRCRWRL